MKKRRKLKLPCLIVFAIILMAKISLGEGNEDLSGSVSIDGPTILEVGESDTFIATKSDGVNFSGGGWSVDGNTATKTISKSTAQKVDVCCTITGSEESYTAHHDCYWASVSVSVCGQTTEGKGSGDMEVTISPSDLTATSYTWETIAPAGVGNLKTHVFSKNGNKATINKAFWFAQPDSSNSADTPETCTYQIKCTVEINNKNIENDNLANANWNVWVECDGNRNFARTKPPMVKGLPFINTRIENGQTIYYVAHQIGLYRSAPVVEMVLKSFSEFYTKFTAHEHVHFDQYMFYNPWLGLFNVNYAYANMQGLSNISQADLIEEIQDIIIAENYRSLLVDNEEENINEAERQAYQISNAWPPLYLNNYTYN